MSSVIAGGFAGPISRSCWPSYVVAPPHSAATFDACTRCGHRATISYNSCRNRHCPKCQTGARERWIQERHRELLPSPYVHVVFTLPSQLALLTLQNKKRIYGLLLRASAETLLEVARNPRYLGAEIGFFSVLHTWNQKLQLHPHVHCVVPSGGLSPDHARWIPSRPRFFLPISVGTSRQLALLRQPKTTDIVSSLSPCPECRVRSVG